MSTALAHLVASRQADVRRHWQAAIGDHVPDMTPEQRRAAGEVLSRLLPAYVQFLKDGSEDELARAARPLAPGGKARHLTLAQLQTVAGCFYDGVCPLLLGSDSAGAEAALGDARAVTAACLAATRVLAAEYQRRILNEASETVEFSFTLAEVTRSVMSSLNLDEVLQVVSREGARLLDADRVLVHLFEPSGELVCHAAWGQDAGQFAGVTVPTDDAEALCARAVQSRRAQTAAGCPGACRDGQCRGKGLTCLAIPIIANEQVLGAMLFADRGDGRRLDGARGTEMVLTAELLVAQVALAIHNAQLHAQVRDLAYALDHIGECVLVADQAGRICYANQAVQQTLGCEPAALLGEELAALQGSESGVPAAQIVANSLARIWEGEVEWRYRGGPAVPMQLVCAPMGGTGEAHARIVVLARDVTDEKRRQAGEIAHRAQLQSKNRELEAFAYTVSHDLRAPLVSLHGLAGMLQAEHGKALGDSGRHLLQRLDANVLRMERLIDDLLQLSRVGRQTHQDDVAVEPLVSDLLEDWRSRLEQRGVAVAVRGPLPVVRANRTSLRQVLENLFGNAVKFMGSGPSPCIEIGGSAAGETAHLYVQDNGIGMAPKYHDKVFDIFQRLQDLPDVDGTGVGLAIVKKAVESWGGRVWIESEVGQGCTVHLTVPVAGGQ